MVKPTTTGTRKAKPAPKAAPARARRNSPRTEKTTQRSVSLRPSQWDKLDVLGDLTQWGRSGAMAQAVDLLMSLPVAVAQRLVTLRQTTAREALELRLQSAVEEAIAAAEAELPNSPWAEYDAALAALGQEAAQSGVADLSERELTDAAEAGKRAFRAERRASSGSKPTPR